MQKKSLTIEELKHLLKSAGFQSLDLKLRTKIRYHSTSAQALETSESSAFGTFLGPVPEGLRSEVKNAIIEELIKRSTP